MAGGIFGVNPFAGAAELANKNKANREAEKAAFNASPQGQRVQEATRGISNLDLSNPTIAAAVQQDQTRKPMDFTKAGAEETFHADNMGFFTTPGQGETAALGAMQGLQKPMAAENFWSQNQGAFQGNMGPGNLSQQHYQDYMGRMPQVAQEPGFGEYYDRAKERSANSINQQLGARGAYGSSVALGQLSDAFTGLDAERANREADYNLARLAEQRGWEQLGGTMAGQADQNMAQWANLGGGFSEAAQRGQMGRAELQGGLGAISDQLAQGRMALGQGSAAGAQNARRMRGRDYADDTFKMLSEMLGLFAPWQNTGLSEDAALFENAQNLGTGAGVEAGNGVANTGAQVGAIPGQVVEAYKSST